MFQSSPELSPKLSVKEIVARDYRTADVFRKYEIEYCCGGKWTLESVCLMKDIRLEELQKELWEATRNLQLPGSPCFQNWNIDFLTDYIINIHHGYLKKVLPELGSQLNEFVKGHLKKYTYLAELQTSFDELQQEILSHLRHEEDVIFPYIRQVTHAYESKDSYAGLLVKTLRKPLDKLMDNEHELVTQVINKFRQLTGNYIAPEGACTNHRVIFGKLKELDTDLTQHIYLENDILFPRALTMEKELLGRTG